MNTIVSPTTNERIVRTVIITGMVVVFSAWFLYDGYVKWPQDNLKKAVESLHPVPAVLPAMQPAVSAELAEALARERMDKEATPDRLTLGDVEERLGDPGWTGRRQGMMEARYFGPGGTLVLQLNGDLVHTVSFEEGSRDDTELAMQKILGFGLIPVAMIMLIQLGRVIATRAALNDDGLKVRGRRIIPFEAMRGLDASQYDRKGFVDLTYDDDARRRTIRLDAYVYRDLDAIVHAICERCEFEDSLAHFKMKREREVPAEP